jgi:hypothetical protein
VLEYDRSWNSSQALVEAAALSDGRTPGDRVVLQIRAAGACTRFTGVNGHEFRRTNEVRLPVFPGVAAAFGYCEKETDTTSPGGSFTCTAFPAHGDTVARLSVNLAASNPRAPQALLLQLLPAAAARLTRAAPMPSTVEPVVSRMPAAVLAGPTVTARGVP